MQTRQRIATLVAGAFVALPCAALGAAEPAGTSGHPTATMTRAAAGSNVVIVWNRTLVLALATANTPAPLGTRLGAIVQSAVFDAVNGIERRYTPIHVDPDAPPGASRAAAAVSAAHEALVRLFPSQRQMLDAQLTDSLADIPGSQGNSQPIARGLAWGKTVADEILAWRATDHFSDPLPTYVPGVQLGDWQPTPPGFSTQPLFRQLAHTTPFALTSPSQFRPVGPPPLTSARYAAAFNEVKTTGSPATQTPGEAATALFWASDTVTSFWDRTADEVADAHNLSLSDDTRLLARLNIALADAAIAVWDAKDYFNTWRPVTAIPQASLDNNPDTEAQAGWTPLLVTPVFQEYPSGHSGVSSAAGTILASVFGSDTSFTVTSNGLPGVEHSFISFSDAVAQVSDARVWGGIHFRFATDDANTLGANVGNYINQTMFLRTDGSGSGDVNPN
jgi:hypothetical protein